MEKQKTGIKRAIKWVRIVFFLSLALMLFYLGVNYRMVVIPDEYVALHPYVLPGQHWVYKRIGSGKPAIFPGDRILFSFQEGSQRPGRHISLLIGRPGDTVAYKSDENVFMVNGEALLNQFDMSDAWDEGGMEPLTLEEGMYLLIDNNAFSGSQRVWLAPRERILGRFLFMLPY